MGWLAAAGEFLMGKTGEKIINIGDELINTSEERQQADKEDLSEARKMLLGENLSKLIVVYQATGSVPLRGLLLLLILLDVLVDCAARLVRPWVSIHILGAFFGYWNLTPVKLDPFQETMVYLVFTFWFGGRAIMKDIPSMLKALRKLKK